MNDERQELTELYKLEKELGNPAKKIIIEKLKESGVNSMVAALTACQIEKAYIPEKKRK